ncbi:MFS transporter [Halosimplex amylolyticum]|uniref:MFS transporter n=1 Tax=Halosimplex amylolyticum TaxID=3396616 RepID=UPI003F54E104
MAETLREALRERLGFWAALQWAGVLAFLWYVLGPSPAQFITTLVSLAIFGLTELVTDVYDVRQSVRNGGIGVYALVGGVAMALFDDGTLWLPVAFVLVGLWFVADAVQTVRHEGATETERTGREVYHDYVARRVHETVEERPHTRRELSEVLEADDDAVDAAVERLESRGVVVREGSSIRAAESEDPGVVGRLRERSGGFVRRLARPLTLELSKPDDDESPPAATERDRDRRVDSVGNRSEVVANTDVESDGRDEGQEREREPTG